MNKMFENFLMIRDINLLTTVCFLTQHHYSFDELLKKAILLQLLIDDLVERQL